MAKSKDAQVSFRLPQELYDRLKEEAGNRGIGDEIRLRLELSFTAPPTADPKSQQLLTDVVHIVEAAAEFLAVPWHENPWVWQAVSTAVNERLKWNKPAGELTPPVMADPKKRDLFGDDPEAAGRMLMGMALFKA